MKVNVITLPPPEHMEFKYITKAEELFVHYQLRRLGSGFTKLFDCIFALDTHNQNKMHKAFPDEVEVCLRWGNERGYAEDLSTRYNKEFGTHVKL